MDDKREIQKQLGCMNGIIQLFDCRYFLGQQRGNVHNHKGLPPPPGQSGKHEMKIKGAPAKSMVKKDPERFAKEKQRSSVESSRTSFSSICLSTETSSSKSIFPEAPSPIITIDQPRFIKPINLRDLVKDSMYRETRFVSVKTMQKEEGVSRTMKLIDSPRPLQQQKYVQPRANSQDKSNRNLREGSWNYKEEKDAPRFSHDERVSQNKLKSSVKLKELQRLSLDSRESSIKHYAVESRKKFLRGTQRSSEVSGQIIKLDQEPGSNKRPSGLVAKLMGLEELPDPSIDSQGEIVKIKPYQNNDLVTRMDQKVKRGQISGSPRVSCKEAASSRMGIPSTATKQLADSRLPLEPAPWRQEGGKQGSWKPELNTKESPTMTPHGSASVYGEIEKRLTELEFKKPGKDLRALKQILEAMQKTRKSLGITDQSLDLESNSSKYSQDYGSWDQHNHSVSPSVKGYSPPKRGQFPIVVIKPAKFIRKPIISDAKETSGLQKLRIKKFADEKTSNLGDPSGGPLLSPAKKTNGRVIGTSSSPKVPEYITGERLTDSRRTSESGSPKLQQRRQGIQNQSSQKNPSDINRERKHSIKKPIRSDGTTKTVKPKSTNSQHKDYQFCGFNRQERNCSQKSDTISMHSESKISINLSNDYKTSNCSARLTEDCSMAELVTATLEQPSPVSVLDAAFCGEGSPSPVKKISNAFTDYETLTCDDAEWKQEGMHHFPSCTSTNDWSHINHVKLENIKQLVDHITLLNSSPNEATTNVTTLVCENRHPDHIYITEIFLASGFLESQGSTDIQLHSSGHLIDPNLFHVLEKDKDYTELANYEHRESVGSKSSKRNRRKLIFDFVNEILVRKLACTGSSELRAISNEVRRSLEVWSEINNLQANLDNNMDDQDDGLISIIRADVNKKSTDWEGHSSELPGLVLDIERLIFKDLINELVSGGVAGLQDQSVRHCKQLFFM